QMNIASIPLGPLTSLRVRVLPVTTSRRLKSGAGVPSATIDEGVRATASGFHGAIYGDVLRSDLQSPLTQMVFSSSPQSSIRRDITIVRLTLKPPAMSMATS